ncbi:hypothetical protein L3X38_028882 [Prunus dulcis]|uniref:Uncharacterized protein n=1 Tax=Prunus dulcis TaxID=3755 RepID=A0AAD4Z1P0_PRUDU|nr:hypothetical protein L3X38_028882 [Prunus dulcis]
MGSSGNRKKSKGQVASDGCFSVYFRPQRQQFAVKTEFAYHSLFKMLLENAETEYSPARCLSSSINNSYGGAYMLLSPSRIIKINQF